MVLAVISVVEEEPDEAADVNVVGLDGLEFPTEADVTFCVDSAVEDVRAGESDVVVKEPPLVAAGME